MSSVFEILNEQLPPMVPRSRFQEVVGPFFGGQTYSPRYLANLPEGEAPKSVKVGKKVYFPREDLVDWLQSKIN